MVINVTKMNTIPSFIIVLIKPVLILTKYDSTGVKIKMCIRDRFYLDL